MQEKLSDIKALVISVIPKEGDPCVYCGAYATDKEHVTPRSWIERAEELVAMGILEKAPEEKIVPSCNECNLIAAARIFDTFADKKAFIRWRLTQKYKKWLDKEQWDDDELEELSGDFRRRTVMYNEILKATQNRLRFIGARTILKHWDYFQKKFG